MVLTDTQVALPPGSEDCRHVLSAVHSAVLLQDLASDRSGLKEG